MASTLLEFNFGEDYLVSVRDVGPFASSSMKESEEDFPEYCRDFDSKLEYSSVYNVEIKGNIKKFVKLIGVCGPTGIDEQSALIIDSSLYVVAGDSIFSLSLPDLALNWVKQVDEFTCFGVFSAENDKALISRGELEIKRIKLNGEEEWSFSGKDIFRNGL